MTIGVAAKLTIKAIAMVIRIVNPTSERIFVGMGLNRSFLERAYFATKPIFLYTLRSVLFEVKAAFSAPCL